VIKKIVLTAVPVELQKAKPNRWINNPEQHINIYIHLYVCISTMLITAIYSHCQWKQIGIFFGITDGYGKN
jgi:hypothetical protein